jgi:hypothetical protein
MNKIQNRPRFILGLCIVLAVLIKVSLTFLLSLTPDHYLIVLHLLVAVVGVGLMIWGAKYK